MALATIGLVLFGLLVVVLGVHTSVRYNPWLGAMGVVVGIILTGLSLSLWLG